MKNWEGLCDIARRKAHGYNYIAVRYKRESLERAEAAFNTFIQELPKPEPVLYMGNDDDYLSDQLESQMDKYTRIGLNLIAMKD